MNQISIPPEAYLIAYTIAAATVWTIIGIIMWVLA